MGMAEGAGSLDMQNMQILQILRKLDKESCHARLPLRGAANLKASPLPPAPIGRLVVDIFVDGSFDPE